MTSVLPSPIVPIREKYKNDDNDIVYLKHA